IAIIGLLTAIALSAYAHYKEQANIARVKSELKTIHLAIEALAADTERWPGPNTVGLTADDEIWDLTAPEAGLLSATAAFPNWQGPYIQSIPTDPWGNPYFFDPDYYLSGSNIVPVIGSFGPNGEGQNDYDADDVYRILPIP
ncbi:MAG: hypothetical protein GTO40_07370, partial [Deltaproteobacteria bacterium]|nr:hypothetical protein [Deltaproteobacteria bacterium]